MEKIPCDENNCSYLEYLNCHISGNTFELKSTTSSMVCSLLDKLCKSKATGLDKISAKLLRYCPDLLSESLTVIFNCSFNTGIFPDEWKCSKVIPLFKPLPEIWDKLATDMRTLTKYGDQILL